MTDIIQLCIDLESTAIKTYKILSDATKEEDVRKFWLQMMEQEGEHVKYWQTLYRLTEQDKIKNMFDTSPKPEQTEVIRSNFIFRIYGNVAWVTYDETIKRNGGDNESYSKPFKELRLLEKGNDGWKIAFVGNLDGSSDIYVYDMDTKKTRNITNEINNITP